MLKRGQITTFIILGVVLLAIVAFFIYMSGEVAKRKIPERAGVPADVAPVQLFVEKCLEKTGDDSVRANSMQGGYYLLGTEYAPLIILTPYYTVPIYLETNENSTKQLFLPSINEMEDQLSLAVAEKIGYCINNFESLPGYKVVPEGNISVNTIITNSTVIFKMNYPLVIGNSKISNFVAEVPLRIGTMYNVASQLVKEQEKRDESGVCLTCYARTAFANNIKVDYLSEDEGYYTVVMTDVSTENPYYFMYAVKA